MPHSEIQVQEDVSEFITFSMVDGKKSLLEMMSMSYIINMKLKKDSLKTEQLVKYDQYEIKFIHL
jgi:hypothetical protein